MVKCFLEDKFLFDDVCVYLGGDCLFVIWLYDGFIELGVFGFLVLEDYGGLGLFFLDVVLV